jgi:hypothetical protein
MAALNEGAVAGDGHIVGVIHEMWLAESEDVKNQGNGNGNNSSKSLSRWGLERPLKDPGAHAAFAGTSKDGISHEGLQQQRQQPIRQLLVAGGKDLQERKKMLIEHAGTINENFQFIFSAVCA